MHIVAVTSLRTLDLREWLNIIALIISLDHI
jgi:hypothetical protein